MILGRFFLRTAAIFTSCTLLADTGEIKLDDYPEVDDVQWGHLRHIARMAGQLDGDWNWMGTKEPDQEGDDGYRYQLSGAASALALAHYHRLPAYREFFQETMEHLIRKMLRREVWGYWENSSRGSKKLDPDLKELGEGWIDPVKDKNIMYSAYLLQMVGMYHSLFADDRYNRTGSLTFDFSPVWRGIELDAQKFVYDAPSLAEAVMRCVRGGSGLGCECEPNAIFVLCNQPAILGLRFYDQTHGTRHADETIDRYREGWASVGGWIRPSGSFVAFRNTAQKTINPLEAPNIDGFTGAWMNPWNREQVRTVYGRQRDQWIRRLPDGSAYVMLGDEVDFLGTSDYGAMLIYASELGDLDTLRGLLAYADKRLNPTWENACLYYPRQDRAVSEDGLPIFMNRFTGNSLIAYARLNVPDGMWKLYHEPFDPMHFAEPYVSGIEYPGVCLTRAIFDRKKKALIVSLKAGPGGRSRTRFRINQLDFQDHYDILDGTGRPLARLDKGKLIPRSSEASKADFVVEEKALQVSASLDAPRTFIVRKAAFND
jgi:hypothetical protein